MPQRQAGGGAAGAAALSGLLWACITSNTAFLGGVRGANPSQVFLRI